MKKNLLLNLILGALILAACGSGGGSEEPAALESVPADFAGKTNRLGANAATDGAKIFQANCETCHGPQGLATIISSGAFPQASPAHPWLPGLAS